MLVKLIEIQRGMRGGSVTLNEIYINSAHIISVSEDRIAAEHLINETKNLGLVEGARFSKIVVSEGSHTRAVTVVGAPSDIHNKIKKRQVLRG